jgi:hypothetical protein
MTYLHVKQPARPLHGCIPSSPTLRDLSGSLPFFFSFLGTPLVIIYLTYETISYTSSSELKKNPQKVSMIRPISLPLLHAKSSTNTSSSSHAISLRKPYRKPLNRA